MVIYAERAVNCTVITKLQTYILPTLKQKSKKINLYFTR